MTSIFVSLRRHTARQQQASLVQMRLEIQSGPLRPGILCVCIASPFRSIVVAIHHDMKSWHISSVLTDPLIVRQGDSA